VLIDLADEFDLDAQQQRPFAEIGFIDLSTLAAIFRRMPSVYPNGAGQARAGEIRPRNAT
jgi:hypothetical protein